MRVGVLADTHLPRFGRRLPASLRAGLTAERLDLLIHLGDFTGAFVVDLLEEIAPVVAVAGNNDPPELVARFGRRRLLEIDGLRLGLVHGDEGRGRTTPQRAMNAFGGEAGLARSGLAAILFGHSHIPLLEWHDGVLLLNPGSPTDKRRQPTYSYGLLEIGAGRVDGDLRTYAERR